MNTKWSQYKEGVRIEMRFDDGVWYPGAVARVVPCAASFLDILFDDGNPPSHVLLLLSVRKFGRG